MSRFAVHQRIVALENGSEMAVFCPRASSSEPVERIEATDEGLRSHPLLVALATQFQPPKLALVDFSVSRDRGITNASFERIFAELFRDSPKQEGVIALRDAPTRHPDDGFSYQVLGRYLVEQIVQGSYQAFGLGVSPLESPVVMMIREALRNAVIWGNRNRPGNIMAIGWSVAEEQDGAVMTIRVIDEGTEPINSTAPFQDPPPGVDPWLHSERTGFYFFIREHLDPSCFIRPFVYDNPLLSAAGGRVGQMVVGSFAMQSVR